MAAPMNSLIGGFDSQLLSAKTYRSLQLLSYAAAGGTVAVIDGVLNLTAVTGKIDSSGTVVVSTRNVSANLVNYSSGMENGSEKLLDRQEPTALSLDKSLAWPDLVMALVLCVLIVITVIGNTLVILSVMTTRRLRTVTNCFVMSLAVADWLVGIFVMPPSVALYLIGRCN